MPFWSSVVVVFVRLKLRSSDQDRGVVFNVDLGRGGKDLFFGITTLWSGFATVTTSGPPCGTLPNGVAVVVVAVAVAVAVAVVAVAVAVGFGDGDGVLGGAVPIFKQGTGDSEF